LNVHNIYSYYTRCLHSVAGIQTRLRTERFGVHIPASVKDFSLLHIIQTDYGGPPSLLYTYTGNLAYLPGVKRPGLSIQHQLNLTPRLRGETFVWIHLQIFARTKSTAATVYEITLNLKFRVWEVTPYGMVNTEKRSVFIFRSSLSKKRSYCSSKFQETSVFMSIAVKTGDLTILNLTSPGPVRIISPSLNTQNMIMSSLGWTVVRRWVSVVQWRN